MMRAARIARRELRGGLRGFRIFLACLTLGVAAIAGVGSVRVAVESGLASEGAAILGGDAEMRFVMRGATQAERDWMDANALAVSETFDFRSMAVAESDGAAVRGLTQLRAVDAAYPLYGAVELSPAMTMAEALAPRDLPGAVMHPVLIARMGLSVGDTFTLGTQTFELRAALIREPDMAGADFTAGPRTIVATAALENSGLLAPGTLFDSQYRLRTAPETDLAALQSEAEALFGEAGLGWRDRRDAAPGLRVFVDRMAAFLVLVGLAGLAVGGIGISAAVRSYLDGKTETIATLKTLGASGRMIFGIYLMQIALLTLLGLALGLILGAVLPLAVAPLIEARLPVPANFGLHPAPLIQAALYGALTAAIFALWPLARTEQIRAATLFRQAQLGLSGWPRWPFVLANAALVALLIAAAALASGLPYLALWSAGGIIAALLALAAVAGVLRIAARRLAKARPLRGRAALRLALGAVGGPGSDSSSVILSLGLGLSVLAAVGQIDSNLRAAIQRDLPEMAPTYFFIDIQRDQLPAFRARVEDDPGVTRVETAPILRGFVTRINDRPALEVAGEHWVMHGDRGITYRESSPPADEVTAGTWWPPGYDGPPLMALSADAAREIGIGVGDTMTVNILGRDITATIAALREVDFSNAGIGFVITMSPNALAGAPHTFIATVYAEAGAEAAILRDVARDAPNITAIRVRDALDQVARALSGIAAATSWAAAATLATGFMVLIGAAAAGERARTFEAAVLKTLGATRARILFSFALRSALQGAAAGMVAVGAGALAGWAVMRFVMETDYRFDASSALIIVIGGAAAALVAGLGFAWRPLAARPARILRARD